MLLDGILFALAIVIISYLYLRTKQCERRLQEIERATGPFVSAIVSPKPGGRSKRKAPVRIFMDGAFDLMHYGHMNAFRQAKFVGDHLIVGVNSDESITKCKGPPILNDVERQEAVLGCRFVDEIVPYSPYIMTEEYIERIMKEKNIDFFVHGDDPCIVDGKDVYETAKQMGKFKTIPRTEGVSTTDIVGRMMLLSKQRQTDHTTPLRRMSQEGKCSGAFYPTSRVLRCFSGALSDAPPKNTDVVVYIAGAWDMFNASDVRLLCQARKLGDYLLVGVHTDKAANSYSTDNQPVLNLHERVLSVLGCKYVDDVILGTVPEVSKDMIQCFGINKVAVVEDTEEPEGAYAVPKDLGIVEILRRDSPRLTVEMITQRIVNIWDTIMSKMEGKIKKERDFYEQKFNQGKLKKILSPETQEKSNGTETR